MKSMENGMKSLWYDKKCHYKMENEVVLDDFTGCQRTQMLCSPCVLQRHCVHFCKSGIELCFPVEMDFLQKRKWTSRNPLFAHLKWGSED